MARAIEPYRDPAIGPGQRIPGRGVHLPERFSRWIEILRRRVSSIPCFTYTTGSPEGVIAGQKGDLYFDKTANQYYFKSTDTGNTGWLLLYRTAIATTAELADITSAINTDAAKILGYAVLNTTTGATVFASGNTDAAVWHFYDESIAHTPV